MKSYVFPCSDHDFHFMRFDEFPEGWEHPDFCAEAYISIGGSFRRTWRDRVQGAWHVLKGCESHSNEILLNQEEAVNLRNALNEHLKRLEK